MRRSTPVLAAAACACALAAAALAADPIASVTQPAGTAGCITNDGTSNGAVAACADGRGLGGAESIALSPDGRFAYTYGYDSGAVAMLTRDTTTGALSEADDTGACLAPTGAFGDCTDARLPGIGSDSAHAIALYGGHLFVAGDIGSSISVFNRNVTTGVLSDPGGSSACISQNGADADSTPSSCSVDAKLSVPQALAVSPDGKFLYSGGQSSVGINAFSINQTTGELTPLASLAGCYSAVSVLGCTQARYASQISDVALSPDGSTLYATNFQDSVVVAFARDGTTGGLAQIAGEPGCVKDGDVGAIGDPCTIGHGISGAYSVQVSPNGSFLSVATGINGLAILHRAGDGGLSQSAGAAGCVNETSSDGCGPSRSTRSIYGTLFTPDSAMLFAAGYGDGNVATSGISVFNVGSDGTLVQRAGTQGCISDTGVDTAGTAGGCMAARGVLGPVGLAMSGDGTSLYATAYSDGGVAHFRFQHAPKCADASATTAFGTAVTIPVTCTDADGDTLTLAGVDGPGHGSVTFSGLSATYTPAAGFSGADSFRVKSSDGANESGPATVSVTVGAASSPPPAGKKTPLKLSISAKPKRDKSLPYKFTFSGTLTPAAGTTCSGKVVVTVKHGKKTVAKKTATLSSACKYKAVVKFSNRKKLGKKPSGKLVANARFAGNAALNAKGSKALTVRYG